MEKDKTIVSILNYNGSLDTYECLKSFYAYENQKEYCIVVWDNCSQKDEQEKLYDLCQTLDVNLQLYTEDEYKVADLTKAELVLVFSKENLGFAKGNNEVLKYHLDQFKYAALLNNDTEFTKNTTSTLVNYLEQNLDTSIVTTAIYYYSNRDVIWCAGGKMFAGTRKYYTEEYVEKKIQAGIREICVEFVTGCYLVMRSEMLTKHGLLTEKFFFGEEDYEFCQRMKKNGIKPVVLLNEKMYHKVGASIKRNTDKNMMIRKSFVHHLNRFINMKDYYKPLIWNMWRLISSIYIYLLMLKSSGFNFSLISKYILLLNQYSKNSDCVNKELFLRIVNGEVF